MSTQISKPWGQETIWAHTDKYAAKLLYISAGHKLSLQYHENKSESILVLSGRIKFHWKEDGDPVARVSVMVPGESVDIPPGMIHRMEAIDNAVLAEVSTPELDDVVRIEDDYGRSKD